MGLSNEALRRRSRSLEILDREGVPYLETLPVIETEAEATRRSTEEVAERAIALCWVATRAQGVDQDWEEPARRWRIGARLTPEERAFIEDPDPSEDRRLQLSWRIEAYWVCLWALGYLDELGRPDSLCDVQRALRTVHDRGRGRFVLQACLRPQPEVLDAADLIYRYHWACRDAWLRGEEAPAGLHAGVVQERHHALNWLILGEDWDDVTTDT